MLKEVFESITTLAQKAVLPEQPVLFDSLASGDGREVSYIYKGALHRETLPPDPRNHHAASAADLVALVLACEDPEVQVRGQRSEVSSETKLLSTKRSASLSSATIFVATSSAVAVLDEARRERVTLLLTPSPHFLLLKTLPKSYPQKDAINFLRRGFTGTGLDNYAAQLRQVVFERQTVNAGKSQRDQESMGKSIDSKVTGTAELPEFLRGMISVYDPSVFRADYAFELGCDPKLSEEQFDFWLAPDTLSLAMLSAQQQLCEYLRDALPGATIVRGSE